MQFWERYDLELCHSKMQADKKRLPTPCGTTHHPSKVQFFLELMLMPVWHNPSIQSSSTLQFSSSWWCAKLTYAGEELSCRCLRLKYFEEVGRRALPPGLNLMQVHSPKTLFSLWLYLCLFSCPPLLLLPPLLLFLLLLLLFLLLLLLLLLLQPPWLAAPRSGDCAPTTAPQRLRVTMTTRQEHPNGKGPWSQQGNICRSNMFFVLFSF